MITQVKYRNLNNLLKYSNKVCVLCYFRPLKCVKKDALSERHECWMIYSHNPAWVVHSAPDIRYLMYSGASFYVLREELSPPI